MTAERDSWQYRIIEHTKGNSTPLGALVLAVLGRNAKNPPWFGTTAVIRADGSVVTSFTDRNRIQRWPHTIGSVAFLTESFSRLADELQLSDADRVALFRNVREWCAKDFRADIRLHFTGER